MPKYSIDYGDFECENCGPMYGQVYCDLEAQVRWCQDCAVANQILSPTAFLVDPEGRTVAKVQYDGHETTVRQLLGYDEISRKSFGPWPVHVFSNAETVDDSSLYGFVIAGTGGAVNRGTCLVVTHNPDCPKPEIRALILPEYGSVDWYPLGIPSGQK